MDHNLIESLQDVLGHYADRLLSYPDDPLREYRGALDIDKWHEMTSKSLEGLHSTAALAAVGSMDNWRKYNKGGRLKKLLDELIAVQQAYLDNFAAEMHSGKQAMNGFVPVRARMYADAAVGTYEAIRRAIFEGEGFEGERRVLDAAAEHCSDCVKAALLGWQLIGTLPAIGDSACNVHCTCMFEYRRDAGSDLGERAGTPQQPPVLRITPAVPVQRDRERIAMLQQVAEAVEPLPEAAPVARFMPAEPAAVIEPIQPAVSSAPVGEAFGPAFEEAPAPRTLTPTQELDIVPKASRLHWTATATGIRHIDGTTIQPAADRFIVTDRRGVGLGRFAMATEAVMFVETRGKPTS